MLPPGGCDKKESVSISLSVKTIPRNRKQKLPILSWAFQGLRLLESENLSALGTAEVEAPHLANSQGRSWGVLTQQDQIPMLFLHVSPRRVPLPPLGESFSHIPDEHRLLKKQTHSCSPRDFLPEASEKDSD